MRKPLVNASKQREEQMQKKKKKGVRVYLACLPNSKENDVAGAQPGKWRW